jgi:adenylate kinase
MKDFKLVVIIGKTGSGKTTFLKNFLKDVGYLVLDIAGSWSEIKEITELSEITKYKNTEKRRITTLLIDYEEEVISEILKLRYINLIIEDADVFIHIVNKKIYNHIFYAYRHYKMNVFVVVHSYSDAIMKVMNTADFFIIFDVKTTDKYKITANERYKYLILSREQFEELNQRLLKQKN